MILALEDVRHNVGRFVLTTIGLGLLFMIVMGMGGIYRGLVTEATLLVDHIGADLWVVQRDTRGPFAEASRVPRSVEDRARAVPGVAAARGFVTHTIQREHLGRPLRMTLQGLAWPEDKGDALPLAEGRALGQAHYEIVVDASAGLAVGERLRLGKETFTVVGLTTHLTSSSGDPMAFLTLADAQLVQSDLSGEATRVERAARVDRLQGLDVGRIQPSLEQRALGPASGIPALGTSIVSAVLVTVAAGHDLDRVAARLEAWADVTVYTHEEQRELLLRGNVDRARRQLWLFRVLLIIISGVILALILYTLTIDKLHDIAMLKLMGARDRTILALIIEQALLMGALGFGLAYVLGLWIFPRFPRRVVLSTEDLVELAAIVAVISLAASVLGVARAMRVDPNLVLA